MGDRKHIQRGPLASEGKAPLPSIARHLTTGLFVTVTAALVIVMLVFSLYTVRRAKKALEKRADESIVYLSSTLGLPFWNWDYATIELIGDTFAQEKDVAALTLVDELGNRLYAIHKGDETDVIRRSGNIAHDGRVVGKISIAFSTAVYRETLRQLWLSSILTILVVLLTLGLVTRMLIRVFLQRPFTQLTAIVNAYAMGRYDAPATSIPYREFRPFGELLVDMGKKILSQVETLQKRETLLNEIQHLTKVGGWEYELDSGKMFWTDEVFHIHGVSQNDRFERIEDSLACYRAEDRSVILNAFQKTCRDGEAYDLECPFTNALGEHLWIRTTARAISEEGAIVRVIGNIMDITEHKEAEEELKRYRDRLEDLVKERTTALRLAKERALDAQKTAEDANRAKSEFLSNMSHELRTPLNAILGYTQLLKPQKNLSELQRSRLSIVHECGEHLLSLIDDLLDFSRIEAKTLVLDVKGFSLPSVLQYVFHVTKLSAEKKHLLFQYEELSPLPAMVSGDGWKLRQILLNLLSNAVKYTQAGSVTICPGYQADSGRFHCEIRDTGIGIPQEHLETIFEPFTQITGARKFVEGAGLGLAITHQLIDLMHGSLSLESEVGQGSTFFVEIDLPEVKENATSEYAPGTRIFDGADKPAASLMIDKNVETMKVPSLETLEALERAVRRGAFNTLERRLDALRNEDPAYAELRRRLQTLVDNYDEDGIRQYLHQLKSVKHSKNSE